MNQCPYCKSELFSDDLDRCPNCGQQVESHLATGDSVSDSMDTFLSDDFEAGDVEQGVSHTDGVETLDDPIPTAAAESDGDSVSDDDTFVADEIAERVVEPGEQTVAFDADVHADAVDDSVEDDFDDRATIAGTVDDVAADVDDDSQGTVILDDESSQHREDTEVDRTVAFDAADSDDAEANDKTIAFEEDDPENSATFVTEPNLESGEHDSSFDQTVQTSDLSADDDSYDATMVSDDLDGSADSKTLGSGLDANESELKTLQSNWASRPGEKPEMTIKSRNDQQLYSQGSPRDTITTVPTRTLKSLTDIKPGTQKDAEYELLNILGEGGMGIVWSAKQTSVDRKVAVKMIKGTFSKKPGQRNKFLAEAIVTGDLDHPNIVPIYDVGADHEGSLFYAMKQVQGTPWLKVIKEKPLQDNLEILLRVADAVAFAHARGIVHRDLKPENVMLGEFGEVLVMDWGLALPMSHFHSAQRIRSISSMGGTPAYMSPEMATGPIDRITPQSDVYLLGAILWEIVTGRPPHPGKKVQQCLLSAMRNTIRETDQSGELVDIARKAMSTNVSDRYPRVKDFQDAVRSYLDHSESLAIAAKSREDLKRAKSSGKYEDYSKAVFGFEQARDLWSGNQSATDGVNAAKLAYAEHARNKEDYDLALSLLSPEIEDHAALRQEVLTASHERNTRQGRLKFAKLALMTMATCFLVVVSIGFVMIRAERNEARRQEQLAKDNEAEANKQRAKAEEQTRIALQETRAKEVQRAKADEARRKADEQRQIALDEKLEQERQRKIADQERKLANEQRLIAEQAKENEEYEAYTARIGLASAKIEENAFDVAQELLDACLEKHRNWEWGRLKHLCSQASQKLMMEGPVDSVEVSPDGKFLLTGSWDSTARVWDLKTMEVVRELPQDGLYVHSAAWSPDQKVIATSGSDPSGRIRLWNAADGTLLSKFNGHTEPVVGVRFSPGGEWLLSCSYDKTARIWDIRDPASPREVQVLKGHSWWVWDGAFEPGFDPEASDRTNRLVTVGHDGKAIIWRLNFPTEEKEDVLTNVSFSNPEEAAPLFVQESVFTGHDGPIYSIDYAPDGLSVATASYDKRVLVWDPAQVPPFNLDNLLVKQASQVSYRELVGHIAPVQSVKFSRDGQLLLSGSRDNAVKVWETRTYHSLQTLRGHDSAVRSVDISQDGSRVISGGQDNKALVWSLDGYEEFRVLNGRTLAGHEDAIFGAKFSQDGHQILTAGRDRTARLWNASTGQQIRTFQEGHEFLMARGVFVQGGQILVTSAADNSVRLWNVQAGTQILRIPGTGRAAVMAVSSDGQWLVTGDETSVDTDESQGNDAGKETRQRSVLVWSVPELLQATQNGVESGDLRKVVKPTELKGHYNRLVMAAFVPNEQRILTCDSHGRAILWDLTSSEPVWSERIHQSRITGIQFTPDGETVLLSSTDHSVSRVNVANGIEDTSAILKHDSSVTSFDLSADGKRALTVSLLERKLLNPGSRVTLWDMTTSQKLAEIETADYAINDVCFTPRGGSAVVVCTDNTVRALNLTETDSIGILEPPRLDFQKLGGLVWSVSFTEDGNSLLTVGGSEARIWDSVTFREEMSLSPHGAVAAADFSSSGKLIVTGSWDNSAKIWDAETGQAIKKLVGGHSGYVNSVLFSPDDQFVLTGSDDMTANLWSVETGSVVQTYRGHQGPVRQALFSPDGKQVLTVSHDRTARLWDRESGQQIGEAMSGHRWGILAAAFSPDGKRIVTGSEDNQARLWSLENYETIAIFEGHTAAVSSVCFSVDGLRVFTASQDNSAKIWDASPGREGQEILNLSEQQQELTSIAVSPDGREVVTGCRDGRAIVWLTSPWVAPPKQAALAPTR